MFRLAFVWLDVTLSASITLAGSVLDTLARPAVRKAA